MRTTDAPAASKDGVGRSASRIYAVVTGGGTGGHVQPALAIAEALVAAGHEPGSIHFVGGRRGIEGRLVPESGFEITTLPGRGLERRLSARNVRSALEIASAVMTASKLLQSMRPRVVVTVGGYAGLPAALGALLLRIPLVVVTYDAVPGAANRLVARAAAANAVAYPGTGLRRSVVTGPPVRSGVLALDRSPAGRASARAELGIDAGRRLVVVTGGSLGAGTINAAALDWCRALNDRADLAVYHVAGDRNLEAVATAAREAHLGEEALDYRLVGFESRFPLLLAACDLVVGRAGASTVAELSAIGVPSILVPLPGAPSDHQTRNARTMSSVGAAVLLADASCTGGRLGEAIASLLGDPMRLESMGEAARSLGHRDAAAKIAAIAESVARAR